MPKGKLPKKNLTKCVKTWYKVPCRMENQWQADDGIRSSRNKYVQMKTDKKYDRFSRFFDASETFMEKSKFGRWRELVFEKIPEGSSVLEVGIGTAKNLPYYGKGIHVTGIDFSKGMLEKARKKLHRFPEKKIVLLEMDIMNMGFPDRSFDFVVSTFVFCTVPDPLAGLLEVKRVLKTDGKAIFLEHMRSTSGFNNLFLYGMSGLTVPLIGTSMVRKTKQNIETAGFRIIEEKNLFADIVKLMVCTR